MRISSRRGCVVAAKRHFALFRCGSRCLRSFVGRGRRQTGSKPADDAPAWRSCYRNWYQWASLAGDDVLHPCPCAGPRCLRSQRRARRPRRAGRARAPRLRHRPAVAKEPAALPARAQRRGAGGAGPHRPRRQRHRAVPPALGDRAALFHRRGARHERPRRGHDAAGGGRGGGARARLPRHPARSARHQPRRDRALQEERLPRVRPPAQILRGRRRRAAVREAARPARAQGGAPLHPPDHRVHLRAGLHDDGAGVGRAHAHAGARRARVPALARSQHRVRELRPGRLRALRGGGRAQAPRPEPRDPRQPRRPVLPRRDQVGRPAPGHGGDAARLPAPGAGARHPHPPDSCERISSDAGIRRGERGHRPRFGLSHGPQRKAALDFRVRPRRTSCPHARSRGAER